MAGYIYIAGSFRTLDKNSKHPVPDNDPHFWTDPPTWGICRPDLRAGASVGDVVFFVLPKASRLPQTIFAYLTINEIISHKTAYADSKLLSKRMGNKIPNGNIIVNANGNYNNVFDNWVHEGNFDRIKDKYAVGSETNSRMLTIKQIQKKAPGFAPNVGKILGKKGTTARDIISQKGKKLTAQQVGEILKWIASP